MHAAVAYIFLLLTYSPALVTCQGGAAASCTTPTIETWGPTAFIYSQCKNVEGDEVINNFNLSKCFVNANGVLYVCGPIVLPHCSTLRYLYSLQRSMRFRIEFYVGWACYYCSLFT